MSVGLSADGDGENLRSLAGTAMVAGMEPWSVRFRVERVAGSLVLTQLGVEFQPHYVCARCGADPMCSDPSDEPPAPGECNHVGAERKLAVVPGRGVAARLLRKIPTTALLAAIYEHAWNELEAERARHAGDGPRERSADAPAAAAAPIKRGPTDDELRDIAELRLQLNSSGRATQEMAELLGLPAARVRDYVHRATEAGWLKPATRGVRARRRGRKFTEEETQ